MFTDEIYEHILYDGAVHVPPGSVPGLEDRTVTISALSKTYSVTGWRVGWVVAPAPLSRGIRSVHDFLTVAAPAPLQEAGEVALALPEEYYRVMADEYLERRDLWIDTLRETGFKVEPPKGAYYVMADIGAFGFPDDVRFARHMVEDVGGGGRPGLVVLLAARGRRAPRPLRVLQEARDAEGSRRTAPRAEAEERPDLAVGHVVGADPDDHALLGGIAERVAVGAQVLLGEEVDVRVRTLRRDVDDRPTDDDLLVVVLLDRRR